VLVETRTKSNRTSVFCGAPATGDGGENPAKPFNPKATAPSLLLTDGMPQMSGPELAQDTSHIARMKVLCMSGYTDDSVVRHGVLDATMFSEKPITWHRSPQSRRSARHRSASERINHSPFPIKSIVGKAQLSYSWFVHVWD